MKKINFNFLITFAFFFNAQAQTLIVKNTTNNYNLDVTTIKKWPAGGCNASTPCTMVDMTGIVPGGSSTQSYPTA